MKKKIPLSNYSDEKLYNFIYVSSNENLRSISISTIEAFNVIDAIS
jgi:hypothetical protein